MTWNQKSFDRAQARYDNASPEDDYEKCVTCGDWVAEVDEDELCEDCEREERYDV